MRILIKKLLKEALQSMHYSNRVFDRFLKPSTVTIGYEKSHSYGEYEEVGQYKISEELKGIIQKRTKLIEDYNFSEKKSYAIKITDIFIDKEKIRYYTESIKNEVLNSPIKLLFLDDKTNTNGNQIYAIIRNNKIRTAFFGKSYSMKNIKEKLNVDVYIKNIENFIDEQKQKQQQQENPKNENLKIFNIDGVKWVVDIDSEKIYKKNKPNITYDVYKFIEKLPEDMENKILSFLIK